MKKKLIFCISIVLCILMCISSIPFSAYIVECPVDVTSRAAFVANLETETVVYEKNSDGIRYLSYLTHIMTYIVARSSVASLDEKVEIKPEVLDSIVEPDNSLDKFSGKILTANDLFHYMLLKDSKDAAFVIADYVSNGKVEAFVELMNKRARSLGCEKTVFVSPSIIKEPTQYSTCEDMYKIVKCALDTPDYKEIASSTSYLPSLYDGSNKKSKKNVITTTNSLLKPNSPYYFKHVKNGVYGADSVARGNVVAMSEYSDVRYVCIIMGAQVLSEHNAFTETKQLLTWAYVTLGNKQIVSQSKVLQTIDVSTEWGKSSVNLTTDEDIVRTVPGNYNPDLLTYKVDSDISVSLPVFKGQNIGTAELYYDDMYFDEINLIASTSQGVSMLGDMRSFFASMADATLVPVKVDETTEESVAQTEEPTTKPTKTQTEQ